MTHPISFGEPEFSLVSSVSSSAGSRGKTRPETPFRIAVLGDFSGQSPDASRKPLADRRVIEVDRDNIDSLLSRLKVRLTLPAAEGNNPPEVLSFTEMDDFHPDRMVERLGLFQALRKARKKVDDPRAFAETLGQRVERRPQPPPTVRPVPDTADFLDQVIDATAQPPEERKPAPRIETEWDRFIEGIVSPHAVANTTDLRNQLKAKLDTATGEMMAALLHLPDFQRIEALWRGLAFLVRRIETGEHLQVFLIDVSQEDLSADLRGATDLRETGMYKLLVEKTVSTPGAIPWSLLVGAYAFSPTPADLEPLARMAQIAHQAGAPFLSGASQQFLGCGNIAQPPIDPSVWENLRRLPEAGWVGLSLPRFLLRLPYGRDTDPTERFDFEEMPDPPVHSNYLWGNPAFVCAYLLAKAFHRDQWHLKPGIFQEVNRLPLHTFRSAGEVQAQPPTETPLTEHQALAILDAGLMPIVSLKDQDRVRLVRFQSIADPPTQLAGPWL